MRGSGKLTKDHNGSIERKGHKDDGDVERVNKEKSGVETTLQGTGEAKARAGAGKSGLRFDLTSLVSTLTSVPSADLRSRMSDHVEERLARIVRAFWVPPQLVLSGDAMLDDMGRLVCGQLEEDALMNYGRK